MPISRRQRLKKTKPSRVYNKIRPSVAGHRLPGTDMLALLLLVTAATAHRGHYIVDYQRLPLFQEFYMSPGVYRPLFPARQEAKESRAEPEETGQPTDQDGPPVAQALQEPQGLPTSTVQEQGNGVQQVEHVVQQHAVQSVPVLKYSNSMTPDGSYSYKYETADGLTREESSVMEPGAEGQLVASVKGSYSYPGPDGRVIRVDYVADQGGFRATGDHLPSSLTDTVYNFKYVVP